MAQNPKNIMTSTPGSASPSTVKGKASVAGGAARKSGEVGKVSVKPASIRSGAEPVKGATQIHAPQGVKLGTTRGNHHVAHAIHTGGSTTSNSIMQGK